MSTLDCIDGKTIYVPTCHRKPRSKKLIIRLMNDEAHEGVCLSWVGQWRETKSLIVHRLYVPNGRSYLQWKYFQ